MIKAKINGETVELTPDQIELEDGYGIITPDSVPDGYFSQDAVNSMIQDRVKRVKTSTQDELLEDESFNKRVLSKYNISLGEDGNPKGIKTEDDVEKIRESVAKQVSEEYENKLSDYQQKLKKRDQSVVESSILSAVSGNYKEDWVKSFDGEKPLAVKHFADRVGVDENGNPYVKDEQGNPRYKGDGLMSVQDYLLDENKFGSLMRDKRQRGSNFQNNGTATSTPSGNPSKWDTKKKLNYISEHGRDGYKKAIDRYRSEQKQEA